VRRPVVVSDTAMFEPRIPRSCTACAATYLQVDVGNARDLHSANTRPVMNPLPRSATMIAALKTRAARSMVPGFYDKGPQLHGVRAQGDRRPPPLRREVQEVIGPRTSGARRLQTLERLWARHDGRGHGIGAVTGEGARRSSPRGAREASMRLVPDQKAQGDRAPGLRLPQEARAEGRRRSRCATCTRGRTGSEPTHPLLPQRRGR